MALTDKLTAIANAIRAKTGKSATMTIDEMPTEIANISGGGGITPVTVTATITSDFNSTNFYNKVIKPYLGAHITGNNFAIGGTITDGENNVTKFTMVRIIEAVPSFYDLEVGGIRKIGSDWPAKYDRDTTWSIPADSTINATIYNL